VFGFEEINEYYNKLGITCYWGINLYTLEELNIITETFKEVHDKYPDVIIEEIGDCFTFDTATREDILKLGKELLGNIESDNNEYFKNHQSEINGAKENIKVLLKDEELKKIDKNDKKYNEADFSAEYYSRSRKILFNHAFKNKLKKDTYHEFGHAVAYQYGINTDTGILKIYESSDTEIIKIFVSEYATTNISEFIAEIFSFYYMGERNKLINKVMKIIKNCVKNGKVMTETERLISKLLNFEP
jgi:hypothetical protein